MGKTTAIHTCTHTDILYVRNEAVNPLSVLLFLISVVLRKKTLEGVAAY